VHLYYHELRASLADWSTIKSISACFTKVLTKKVVLDYDEATDMLVRTYLGEDLDTDTYT
jgi:hypothetical protein